MHEVPRVDVHETQQIVISRSDANVLNVRLPFLVRAGGLVVSASAFDFRLGLLAADQVGFA